MESLLYACPGWVSGEEIEGCTRFFFFLTLLSLCFSFSCEIHILRAMKIVCLS